MLRAILEDGYHWIVSAVCDGRPTEIDYVLDNWTHTQIIEQYAIKVYNSTARIEEK